MSDARELTEQIEELERRLDGVLTPAERNMMTLARVGYIGQLSELMRQSGGETEAEAMRRAAHDNGGGLLGTFDSARPDNPLQSEREALLEHVLKTHGAEAMANVEGAMMDAEREPEIPEWQQQARAAADGYL
jgi:hypothetical protein